MDEPTLRNLGRRRLVPPDLRKRTAVSCDLCKIRRRKCVPSTSPGQCKLCQKKKVKCVSTIPRKERVYGSYDTQSQRHSLLENIVRRLFPEADLDDTEELVKLSESVGQSHARVQWNRIKPPARTDDVKSIPETFLGSRDQITAVKSSLRPNISTRCERILKNASGTLSYFGPSSSMAFVMKLRELLALKANRDSACLPPKQNKLREDFVADRRSCTMEVDLGAANIRERFDMRSDFGSEVRPARCDNSILGHKMNQQNAVKNLASILPPQTEVEELVELFFVRVHPNLALFHRPSFQAALENTLSKTNDNRGSVDVGWMSCICLVLAFGCERQASVFAEKESADTVRVHQLQKNLLHLALGSVSHLILSTTVHSVQALTLLSMYLNCSNERNASWVMMGCAMRMAIGLGLHREESLILNERLPMSPVEREIRKRVWWSLYIFEQYCSGLFGRPGSLQDELITADLPNESILDEGYHQPPGLLRSDIRLASIVGKLNESQNEQKSSLVDGGQRPQNTALIRQLLAHLNNWRESLPSFLSFDEARQDQIYPSHFRQILSLQLRYQHARLTLTRPFHLRNLQQLVSSVENTEMEVADPSVNELSHVCVNAALESWKIIKNLWKRGQFDGNLWFDGIFAYQCALVLSLTLLDPRAKLNWSSRKEIQEATQSILNILHEAPLNKTMNRLVQISTDFATIVRAMDPQSVQNNTALDSDITDRGRSFGTFQCPRVRSAEDGGDLGVAAPINIEPPMEGSFSHENRNEVFNNSESNDLLTAWDFEGAGFLDSLLNGDTQLHVFGV